MKIAEALKERRVRRERSRLLTGKRWIVADHKSWGNAIHYSRNDDGARHWYGWTPVPPQVGDEFVAETVGGPTLAFMVTSVERQRDPDDMWFATTHQHGEVVST